MVRIALRETFRYIHEPLDIDEDALSLLGNSEIIDELRSRLINSRGGTFLVAGFRGVGKSTLVARALEQMRRESEPTVVVLPVVLSVARSTTTDQLLFALVRRVFETLSDSAVLQQLPPNTQHSLLLSYMRTSLSFKETQTKSAEQGGSLEVGAGTAAKSVTRVFVPKMNLSAKRTRSLATEASFLAYSETDVEHDLMRIISLLNKDSALDQKSTSWIHRLWPWRRPRLSRLRLVIVLDEVDKLTTGQSGLAAIEELFSGLKNVLTTAGAHFLMVTGPDLHDRAVKDVSRGNSVYESVFSWLTYVPCTWDAAQRLLDGIVAEPLSEMLTEDIALFVEYLRFKARGIPRRLLQEFNRFIIWDKERPFLNIDEKERTRLAFYARLEQILADYFTTDQHEQLFPISLDKDRRRLGTYYTVDWIVRSAGRPFTALDLVRQGENAELDPLLQLPQRVVERLLAYLMQHQVVEIVKEQDSSAPIIGDVTEAQLTVYKLADNATRTLLGFALHDENERAALEISRLSFPQEERWRGDHTEDASILEIRPLGSRYELHSLLGQGGMGAVYRGRDRIIGRDVAIKILPPGMAVNKQAIARFRREASIASTVRHPQVVQTYDVVTDPTTGLALVMELLPGPTLREIVKTDGPLPAVAVARLGCSLADALQYLENHGLVRLDLKPSNVMMHSDRGPVIIDLGLARSVDGPTTLTSTGALIGTPGYMAPEQIKGVPVDGRVDIYALGLILYFSLTGGIPWGGEQIVTVIARIVNEDVDVSKLPVSPEFQAVIARATARDRERRFPDAASLRDALVALPEFPSAQD